MNREAAIKLILKLIGMILETYRCSVGLEGQQWLLRHGDFSSLYPDQISAVLAGCERVIGTAERPAVKPE